MALYDYSGVSAVTASSVLPFAYWNAFVSFNASSFNASITAHSAIARTASAVAFEHSARISGVHGMSANARALGLAGIANQTFAGASGAFAINGDSFGGGWIVYAGSVVLGGGLFGLVSLQYNGDADLRCWLGNIQAGSAEVRAYKAGAGTITVTAHILVHGA